MRRSDGGWQPATAAAVAAVAAELSATSVVVLPPIQRPAERVALQPLKCGIKTVHQLRAAPTADVIE